MGNWALWPTFGTVFMLLEQLVNVLPILLVPEGFVCPRWNVYVVGNLLLVIVLVWGVYGLACQGDDEACDYVWPIWPTLAAMFAACASTGACCAWRAVKMLDVNDPSSSSPA